jgi:hypothetical protein
MLTRAMPSDFMPAPSGKTTIGFISQRGEGIAPQQPLGQWLITCVSNPLPKFPKAQSYTSQAIAITPSAMHRQRQCLGYLPSLCEARCTSLSFRTYCNRSCADESGHRMGDGMNNLLSENGFGKNYPHHTELGKTLGQD